MNKPYLVDPFIPASARRRKPLAAAYGVRRVRERQPAAENFARASGNAGKRTSMLQKFQLPFITFGAIVAGTLAQSLVFGELAIVVYAIFAIARHIASRTTFLLALIAFLSIVLLLLISNSALAANFAVYAFLLLAVGTISLGTEVGHGNTGRL